MADKMEILGSPLGMYSLLRDDYIISILNDSGTINTKKLGSMVAHIANMGANGLRDFFWIDSEDARAKISPFWRGGDGSITWNDSYFSNQKIIAQACNKANLRYYLSVFDECGTKVSKRSKAGNFNPWIGFDNFFYGDDATEVRHQFLDRIVTAFEGLDTGIELCNEPAKPCGSFLADTFLYLFNEKKFDPRKIIMGIDYYHKEHDGREHVKNGYDKEYRIFRDDVADALGKDWKKKIKTECISPVHNADQKRIDALWAGKAKPGGDRRILYSMDGVGMGAANLRPDKDMMKKIGLKVLNKKTKSREQDKVHFEILYGKQEKDPKDSIAGISEAYNEIWGEFPANFGKFPDAIILGDPESKNSIIVERTYQGILGRASDKGGKKGHVEYLDSDGNVLQLCKNFTSGSEYLNRRAQLSVEQYAEGLYKGILGRPSDEAGLTHTINLINRNKAAERAAAMLESPEFKKKWGIST